jgi:hypothetical protein
VSLESLRTRGHCCGSGCTKSPRGNARCTTEKRKRRKAHACEEACQGSKGGVGRAIMDFV